MHTPPTLNSSFSIRNQPGEKHIKLSTGFACRRNTSFIFSSYISQPPTAPQMTANGADMSAESRMRDERGRHKSNEEAYFTRNNEPRALREALRLAGSGKISTPSESASEEDYDEESQKPIAVLRLNKRPDKDQATTLPRSGSKLKASEGTGEAATPSDVSSENGTLDDLSSLRGAKVYTVASDDKELRDILRRGLQRVSIEIRRCEDGTWLMMCRPKNQRRV